MPYWKSVNEIFVFPIGYGLESWIVNLRSTMKAKSAVGGCLVSTMMGST
jgi:hypothetical protein